MVVIVWTGWKGRMGQLWTWIYTAWPWLTGERPYFWSKKPRCRGSKKLAGSMCIRMHARRFARTTRISQRDEPAQWQLSQGPTHVLHDANASVQRGGPCLPPTSDPLVRADVLLGQSLRARSASKLIFLQTSGTWLGVASTRVFNNW